jgi:hypothetical protein
MKRGKKHMTRGIRLNNSPAIKMSELIAEYASDYINLGDTTEERQSFLNGACTAWNIANLPDHLRETALQQTAQNYEKMNPGIVDVESYLHDMRILIQKKLQMFPNIRKTIVNAFVEPINGTQYRINVLSTDHPEALLKC